MGAYFPFPFLSALFKKIQRDNAFFLARGLAFDVLICLIPALFLLFVLIGFLFDSPKEADRYLTLYLKSMIPFSRQQVLRSLCEVVRVQKIWGILSVIGLFWTLMRVFSSSRTVLNVVFEVQESRGILAGKIFDLKMMLLGSLLFLITVLITSLSPLLKSFSPHILGIKIFYLGVRGELMNLLLAFFFTVGMFFFLYQFGPHRRIPAKKALYSALIASILWELAKQGFRFYILHIADLNRLYGSFGLLLALVLWVYYSCIIFIFSAEIGWIAGKK